MAVSILLLPVEAHGVVHVGWSMSCQLTSPACRCRLCLDSGVNAPPAEFSSHLEGKFSAAWADRSGLTQDSSVDVDEQVLLGLVLDLDGDVLVAVLINL